MSFVNLARACTFVLGWRAFKKPKRIRINLEFAQHVTRGATIQGFYQLSHGWSFLQWTSHICGSCGYGERCVYQRNFFKDRYRVSFIHDKYGAPTWNVFLRPTTQSIISVVQCRVGIVAEERQAMAIAYLMGGKLASFV